MTRHIGDEDANDHAFDGNHARIMLDRVASGGDGTSPQNRGSTGWTGAHPQTGGTTLDQSPSKPKGDATTGQSPTVHDEFEAKDQPEVATGEDLKGAPRQFPPSKTPE